MRRPAVLIYGVLCYAVFFTTFLYTVGFIGNFLVPTRLDQSADGSLATAIAVNSGLLLVFALQHSVMARPAFKRWWTRFVPDAIERSTYCLASSLALILLFTFWQPVGGTVWNVTNATGQAILYGLFAAGWVIVLLTTFMINHFDLFGLRQTWLYFQGKPYTSLPFKIPGLYRYVRHPLYVGWIMAIWFTPTMTASHMLFASLTTIYILVAIQFEERDLVSFHGKNYTDYQSSTPMLVPRLADAHSHVPAGRTPTT